MILNCSSATLLQSWSDLNFISNIEWSLISWLVVTCQYPSTWTFSNPLKQALISHFRIYPDCRGSTLFRRCRKWHSLLCPLGKLMRIQYSKRKYGEVAICILCSTRHVTTYTWDSVEADCLVDKLRPDLFGLSCFQVLYECNCCSLRHCTPHWDKEGQRECKWPQNPRHPWTVQRRSPQPNRGTHGVWVVEAQLPRVATRLSEGRHPWLRWLTKVANNEVDLPNNCVRQGRPKILYRLRDFHSPGRAWLVHGKTTTFAFGMSCGLWKFRDPCTPMLGTPNSGRNNKRYPEQLPVQVKVPNRG